MTALTTEERRRLNKLAGELVYDYPQVARALVGAADFRRLQRGVTAPTQPAPSPRRRAILLWLPAAISLASLPLLILGAVLGVPALIGCGAAAMVTGPALSIGIVAASRRCRRDGGRGGGGAV